MGRNGSVSLHRAARRKDAGLQTTVSYIRRFLRF